MKLYVYASAEAVIARPELLSRLSARYNLRGVIIRSAEVKAFEIVLQQGLEALWLAPGLWGHVAFEDSHKAVFLPAPDWDSARYPAYERQFPMHCPTRPGLAEKHGRHYADTVNRLGATGVFGTHLRYHHPANIEHLWGCACEHCRAHAPVDIDLLPQFWSALRATLQNVPALRWDSLAPAIDEHPLVAWWAAVAAMDFPIQWFEWKNESIGEYLARLRTSFEEHASNNVFATNCFEPLLGPLVGQKPDTQRTSDWYAPLLGYWPHHVHESINNLAAWHRQLVGGEDLEAVRQAITRLVGLDSSLSNTLISIEQQLRLGAANAARIKREYYPVLNGTIAHKYGGTADQFPLSRGIELASELGASGIITQGISQLLDDPTLDFWF